MIDHLLLVDLPLELCPVAERVELADPHWLESAHCQSPGPIVNY